MAFDDLARMKSNLPAVLDSQQLQAPITESPLTEEEIALYNEQLRQQQFQQAMALRPRDPFTDKPVS